MNADDDRRFMALAIALGQRGLGRTWPNPAVGCVIVRDGRIVGRGWTRPGGRPHAETMALAQAGVASRGATAYVSLEPCAHHGQTPPCSQALIEAGISRVVSAITDPDARVAGKGHAMLRDAGISVETGVLADQATSVQRGFLWRIINGRPLVTLKLATSLDGRIATAAGESRWITGPAARRMVHLMRARHDAVLIGAGTARADDPALTVRDLGITAQPVRIVAARTLDLSSQSTLARTARDVPLWLLHGSSAPARSRAALGDAGARLIEVPESDGTLDLTSALGTLAEQGLTRIFCEGGGQLASALLRAGLVDDIALFGGGLVLGGDARPAVGPMGLAALAQASRWRLVESRDAGADSFSLWSRSEV